MQGRSEAPSLGGERPVLPTIFLTIGFFSSADFLILVGGGTNISKGVWGSAVSPVGTPEATGFPALNII